MKTLHIGNIANNAYLAARKEREIGIDAHVISIEYSHVMGFPEWEEKEFSIDLDDHFKANLDFPDFRRPNWFHSGTWQEIFNSLEFVDKKNNFSTKRVSSRGKSSTFLQIVVRHKYLWKKVIPLKFHAFIAGDWYYRVIKKNIPVEKLKSVFSNFDYVTFYGPSTYLAQFLGRFDYLCFEHGTLRDFIEIRFKLNKDVRLGYVNAAVNLISNQDNLVKALSLKLNNPIKTPHPILDDDFPKLRMIRQSKLNEGGKFRSILVPARHTISSDFETGKGSEKIYEAIEIFSSNNDEIVFDLIEWGDGLSLAKLRLKYLESKGRVRWHRLMSRPLLKQKMAESLAIIDQINVPAYGAITADAIGLGVPTLTRHLCSNDLIFFGSCAPVMNCESSETLLQNIETVVNYSIGDVMNIIHVNSIWFENNLSSRISLDNRLLAYGLIDRIRNK